MGNLKQPMKGRLEFQISAASSISQTNLAPHDGVRDARYQWYLECGCKTLSWRQIIWRIVNGLMAILFAAATVFQWNDPDTHVWTIVYIIPCLLSLSVAIWIHIQDFLLWKLITVLHIVGSLGGMIFLSIKYGEKISAVAPNITSIEEGWELCGLLFVILWLCFLVLIASYRACWQCYMRQISQSSGVSGPVVFRHNARFEPEHVEY